MAEIFHMQLTAAPAMSSSLGAIFFRITLGLQQTAFHVPTWDRSFTHLQNGLQKQRKSSKNVLPLLPGLTEH